MEDKILDTINETTNIHYNSRDANISIAKGIAAFIACLSLIAFYLWCRANMLAFTSGRAERVVGGFIIYALLLLGYSVFSIFLGVKMKENNQRSVLRLEIINTIIQIAIALLLLTDWWYTFEINVL